jgi:hypothetical protein
LSASTASPTPTTMVTVTGLISLRGSAGSAIVTAVPEPSAAWLAWLGLAVLRLRRRAAAIVGLTVVAMTQSGISAEMTLNRYSRPVTAAEAAGGAPAGGMVHDFYATSSADILTLATFFNQSVYKHPYANDYSAPHPDLVAAYPAVGASSFLDTPGSTVVLGGGLAGVGPEKAWGDFTNDGPQTHYQFGRLTTSETGAFAGQFFLRGDSTYIEMPFSFTLPGPSGPLSEELAIFGIEQNFPQSYPPEPTLPKVEEYVPPLDLSKWVDTSLDSSPPDDQHPPSIITSSTSLKWSRINGARPYKGGYGRRPPSVEAVPEPVTWILFGVGLPLLARRRLRRNETIR